MNIQATEYIKKIASELTKEAAPKESGSIIASGLRYAKPLAGAYLGVQAVKKWKKLPTKQRVGTAAATLILADLLTNPTTRRAVADGVRHVSKIPRRRRRITKGDLAVAAGLGAAGIVGANKIRALHRRATYGSDQPAYNTTPVYYTHNAY